MCKLLNSLYGAYREMGDGIQVSNLSIAPSPVSVLFIINRIVLAVAV